MNKKAFVWIVVVFAVLCGIFFITPSSYEHARAPQEGELFNDFPTDKIAKIEILQGADKLELELKDNRWTVPAREFFPANFTKVRSTMLKILALNVSQRITDTPASFEQLGVSDEDVTKGKTKVIFSDNAGKELGGIIIGELRKKAEGALSPQGQGQYVRRVGSNDVYLVSEAIIISPKPTEWLENTIVNVLQSQVESVLMTKPGETGASVEYELIKANGSNEKTIKFTTKAPLATGLPADEAKVSQVVGGLENLRLEDVLKSSDEKVKGLQFDIAVIYRLNNGLEYKVATAEEGDKFYAKVGVAFNQDLADALTKAHEDRVNKATASSAEATASSGSSASSSSSVAPLNLSSAEKAAELSKGLEDWIYVIPKYNAEKLRSLAINISQQQPSSSSASSSSAGHHG